MCDFVCRLGVHELCALYIVAVISLIPLSVETWFTGTHFPGGGGVEYPASRSQLASQQVPISPESEWSINRPLPSCFFPPFFLRKPPCSFSHEILVIRDTGHLRRKIGRDFFIQQWQQQQKGSQFVHCRRGGRSRPGACRGQR